MIIGIDTGKNIGMAFILGKKIKTKKIILNTPEDCRQIINFVDHDYKKIKVFIEDYIIYNSPKSILSAVSGDLKYVIKTGILLQSYFKELHIKCFMVSPRWKGTMDDKHVKTRVLDCVKKYRFTLDSNKKSSHEWDAIGLCLHGLGLFNICLK